MEGNLPGNKNIEEERRIAFVGLTRAKTHLFALGCSSRPMPWGARNIQHDIQPSRFLAEAFGGEQ
jgi:superfamily I DNA/RNA helicase